MDAMRVAVTIGDPAGIGPEVALRAAAWAMSHDVARPVLVGSYALLQRYATRMGVTLRPFRPHDSHADGVLPMLDVPSPVDELDHLPSGPHPATGEASYRYVVQATELVQQGLCRALVTAPISKRSWQLAGIAYLDHTALLAALTKREPLLMFQTGSGLKVLFFTRHLPLREAVQAIRREPLERFLKRAYRALQELLGKPPRLAVAALNPHAGEEGMLGREEIEELEPAVQGLRHQGLEVEGPVPADAVFFLASQGAYDAVVALYHDQGHIACKTVDFFGTVSVTLGLPFIRTSPDHGTAFSLVGTGRANPRSMMEAIRWASKYAEGTTS